LSKAHYINNFGLTVRHTSERFIPRNHAKSNGVDVSHGYIHIADSFL